MKKTCGADHIRNSPFFDETWYRRKYLGRRFWKNPAAHYLVTGAEQGFDPGPDFSTRGYLAANPDVGLARMNPLLHYELYGRAEGRRGFERAVAVPDHAVIAHARRPGCLDVLRAALAAFPEATQRYVSFPAGSGADFEALIRADCPGAVPICVEESGGDAGAFLQILDRIDRRSYGFFCKIHSGMGGDLPAIWREAAITGTAGNTARVAQFARIFRDNPNVLLGGTRELFLHGPSHLGDSPPELTGLLQRAGFPAGGAERDWGFFSGACFWVRSEILDRLPEDLPSARDGHIELLIGRLAAAMDGEVALASCTEPDAPVTVCQGLPDDMPRHPVALTEVLRAVQSRLTGLRLQEMKSERAPGLGFSRAGLALARARREAFAIITPTGDRPVAFNQCIGMVATQSVQPKEWIVVDDGVTPLTESLCLPDWATYVRRAPVAGDPPHSLSRNVLAALDHITADKVLIFEDDDWYAPLYAEFMLPWLDSHDLVGLHLIRYYHLRGSAWKHGLQPAHTAFAQSAFRRGPAWEHLAQVCRSEHPEIRERGIVDRHWWHSPAGRKQLIDEHPALHLGLKGGFGRPGLASGHERREIDYIPDPEGAYLSDIIGPDRMAYARWQKTFRKPYVVYTCRAEGGAAPGRPAAGLLQCDFYAFAAGPEGIAAPWQAVPLDERCGTAALTAAKPMSLPHLYFPEYEWSLWVPPGTAPTADLERLAARAIESGAELVLAGQGQGQGTILRRHNSPVVARAMVRWWHALHQGEEGTAALLRAAEAEGVALRRL